MKPQSLQDAIKAAATKKKSKIAQGGWKEPAIKQHKLSADEFKNIKKPQSPVSVSAYAPPSYNNEGGTEVVQRLERECNELKKENLIIVKEMQEYRLEMKQYAQEMKENRSEMDQLRKDMAKMRAETETPKSGHTSDDSLLVPKPSIPQPYTTIELYESQRKDKTLREFMQSQTGLPYTAKNMSVTDIDGNKLVYFKKKVYIPVKLRRKTVKFYCESYPDDAHSTLRKNCIWPERDEDVDNHLKRI